MRVTVSHTKTKQEVMQAVDRSFDDLFRGISGLPVQLVDEQRVWKDSTLAFTLSAKMGFVRTPIKGTIDVTDRDITIDADLGLFERLIPAAKARETLTGTIRGLLN